MDIAARTGTVLDVEAELGRHKGDNLLTVAKEGARIALESERWDNLSYLADFLHDTTSTNEHGLNNTVLLELLPADEDKPLTLSDVVVPS